MAVLNWFIGAYLAAAGIFFLLTVGGIISLFLKKEFEFLGIAIAALFFYFYWSALGNEIEGSALFFCLIGIFLTYVIWWRLKKHYEK
jgi:hypothetical protein